MKILFITVTLCMLKFYAAESRNLDSLVSECIKELKLDINSFKRFETEKDSMNREFACYGACLYRRLNKAKTLNESLKILINQVEADNNSNNEIIIDEARNKLERCAREVAGQDECELMQCVDFDNSPFRELDRAWSELP